MTPSEFDQFVRDTTEPSGFPAAVALAVSLCCFIVFAALLWWGLS